jgi:two-component system OmpR family sensor kinase
MRLVLGLVGLLVIGLGLFGFATFSLYARSAYARLDEQVRGSQALVARQLRQEAGLEPLPGDRGRRPGGGPDNGPPVFVPPGTYGELRDPNGTIIATMSLGFGETRPELPARLVTAKPDGSFFSASAEQGSGRFRVLVAPADGRDAGYVVVALPMTEVTNGLHRLVLIESVAAAFLLLALSAGSWLVLRGGLRPLEQMAADARSITTGDLSQRVSPSGGPTEVGQLGLALNTMLGDIEAAFAERAATEQRLRQFLSDASHELRTPLTSIQGFAELFRVSGDKAKIDLPTILRRIEQESARMRDLVEDLLLLARLDETRPVQRKPVDVAVLAADACSDTVASAPDRNVTLDAPKPVVVECDEGHVRQAIANLMANAVRHTPAGTAIEVRAHSDGTTAEITVRDHGPGLDQEALAHVFDRFWQRDAARVGVGAGLGLAIVAGIAAEHGGEATVANAPDGGAVFTVRLPARRLADA